MLIDFSDQLYQKLIDRIVETEPTVSDPIVQFKTCLRYTKQALADLELHINTNPLSNETEQRHYTEQVLPRFRSLEFYYYELAWLVCNRPTDSIFKAIPAFIDGNQKVLQGGIVKLRLNDSIRIKGQAFPKGTLLFGNAMITNQRLLLEIKNIRLGTAIIPVGLVVYSLDGLPGINAPDAEIAGAAGEGANNAMESMQFLAMDQNLATQAAAGGISAAKTLFGKKVRRIKVKLKGGYPILLRSNQIH